MRKELVNIWNHIMRIKILHPMVVVGRKLIFSDTLNAVVDYLERHLNKKNLQETEDFFKLNEERISKNLQDLADERSRQVYKDIIRYRCTLNRKYLHAAQDPCRNQYFSTTAIHFKKQEFFIDCGAYTGDTIWTLSKKYPYWGVGRVVALCLEPDKYNAAQCSKNIKKIQKSHKGFVGYVIRKGVWKNNTTLYFKEGEEYSNKLGEKEGENCTAVSAVSVDSVVRAYREKTGDPSRVTFIKMDIEGSEPEALLGAEKTIFEDKPILAVSVYHTKEQMISILEYCRNTFTGYKFYIRHYSPAWGETDLYAVPYEDETENVDV